jgi:hypothetical protein
MLPAGHDSAFLGWFSGRPLVHGFNKGIVLERETVGLAGSIVRTP